MAEQAAKVLRLSAPEVKDLGVVDGIVREPQGGAHRNHGEAATMLGDAIAERLAELLPKDNKTLRAERLLRFRKMGAEFMIYAPLDA